MFNPRVLSGLPAVLPSISPPAHTPRAQTFCSWKGLILQRVSLVLRKARAPKRKATPRRARGTSFSFEGFPRPLALGEELAPWGTWSTGLTLLLGQLRGFAYLLSPLPTPPNNQKLMHVTHCPREATGSSTVVCGQVLPLAAAGSHGLRPQNEGLCPASLVCL